MWSYHLSHSGEDILFGWLIQRSITNIEWSHTWNYVQKKFETDLFPAGLFSRNTHFLIPKLFVDAPNATTFKLIHEWLVIASQLRILYSSAQISYCWQTTGLDCVPLKSRPRKCLTPNYKTYSRYLPPFLSLNNMLDVCACVCGRWNVEVECMR